jgi:hypothetical protein
LDLITRNISKPQSKVKWLVASRYRHDIEKQLQPNDLRQKIVLELNSTHISRAVNSFIDVKVSEFTWGKSYDGELQKVRNHLYQHAEGTFLWVALVCKRLHEEPLWQIKLHLSKILEEFPPGLESLYERMMEQIQKRRHAEFCIRILSLVTLAYRPIHLKELVAIAGLPGELSDDLQSVRELVDLCGSFLTVREKTIYILHQSAKDYLGSKIFPAGKEEGHSVITRRSLEVMSNTLKRDICGLQMPGALLSDASGSVNKDPLAQIRYPCCYWVDHLQQAGHLQQDQIGLFDGGEVHIFLKKHFLHWLEALSLMENMSDGGIMVRTLESMLTVSDSIANSSLTG